MRCHFSPLGPTDRRYIYTASFCGKVFLYDILTGAVSEKPSLGPIDSSKTKDSAVEMHGYTAAVLDDMEGSPIRDAVWHPNKMEIITTNLEGQIFLWRNSQLVGEGRENGGGEEDG